MVSLSCNLAQRNYWPLLTIISYIWQWLPKHPCSKSHFSILMIWSDWKVSPKQNRFQRCTCFKCFKNLSANITRSFCSKLLEPIHLQSENNTSFFLFFLIKKNQAVFYKNCILYSITIAVLYVTEWPKNTIFLQRKKTCLLWKQIESYSSPLSLRPAVANFFSHWCQNYIRNTVI